MSAIMRRIVDALGTNEEDESIVDALLAKRVSSFATRPLRRREREALSEPDVTSADNLSITSSRQR